MRPFALIAAFLACALAAAPAMAAPKKAKDDASSSSGFVIVPAVTATIAPNLRRTGILQVQAGVMTSDPAFEARARAAMPRLRDAFRTESQAFVNNYYRADSVPDADLITRMFQQACDRTLGPGGKVLMVAIIIR
jgi:hypothetical protein